MATRAVHWHEGMFLRPHHFNAAQRHSEQIGVLGAMWDHHHNWGLRSIEIDRDALANNRLVVRALRARMRDGTLVSMPEDGAPAAIDLKSAFDQGETVIAYLAVPTPRIGKSNVSARGGETEGVRYVLETQQVEDENTGTNPRAIKVRLLNLRFLLSSQDRGGYEVLPIARVRRSARAEATPELDTTYFPPVVACDAWPPLLAGSFKRSMIESAKKSSFSPRKSFPEGFPSIATVRETP